jgi:hypothetical protein
VPHVATQDGDDLLIERGGELRLIPVADEKFVILASVMRDNIDKDALLQTDKAVVFDKIGHYLNFSAIG